MTSNPKAPEAMEWNQEGDEQSGTCAPTVETTHT